ncbi:MAG: hypothetical protein EB127_13260 [Alphaproteobacteria bacterium]|nr:hypothetical protein [Alphaproteobacteria bacterium]
MSKEKELELELEQCKIEIMKYQDLTNKKASVEVPGVKVIVTKEDNWDVVAMILVLVLGTYIGVKIINRLFKR